MLTTLLLVALLAMPSMAYVTVRQEGQQIVMENEFLQLALAPGGGGRIAELTYKPSGHNFIALWRGNTEIGGALDDRLFFTAFPYQESIIEPGADQGTVRLEAKHPSGLEVIKTLRLQRGEAILRVSYEFRNGTQSPYRLWVRNFLIPGGPPLTDHHRYFLPLSKISPEGIPFASEYFSPLRLPYAALLNTTTREGLIAVVPGVERFYFWQGSREYPTFEWLYPETPPGQRMSTTFALVLTSKTIPSWEELTQKLLPSLRPPHWQALPGWKNEAERFGITETERQRGFWLSIGRDEDKQRLPPLLELDLPLEETRALYLGINVLRTFTDTALQARAQGFPQGLVRLGWERREENSITVEPLVKPIKANLPAGTESRLWILVEGQGKKPGVYKGQVVVQIGGQSFSVPLRVHLWDVRVPRDFRPFEVRGYATIGDFAGSYSTTPENLKRMTALLQAYADIGGSVLDWTVAWYQILPYVKLAETGELLTEVAKNNPSRLSLKNLPPLDFSSFDLWLDKAKKQGITRVETYLDFVESEEWQWRLLDPALGSGRVKAGTPQAERVIEWILRELRRYFEQRGFRGFFAKISDEISPEHIPNYLRTAQVARRAGWRPFTTITGLLARTAEYISTLNPYCDQWQVAIVLKEDFQRLLRKGYRPIWKECELTGTWKPYQNGGAEGTWWMQIFGSIVPEKREEVDRLLLQEDGKPLQERGRSPWGNKERGVYFPQGEFLYLAPQDGSDPNSGKHRYTLRYLVLIPDPKGKPLAAIDKKDEVWFYGGSSHPYRTPYEAAMVYPLLAAIEGKQGYGWWAFQWYQPSEKIVWYDEKQGRVQMSPAYLGLRDGWQDARLLVWGVRQLKALRLDYLVSNSTNTPLHWKEAHYEVYHWRSLAPLSPLAFLRTRRLLLEAIVAQRKTKGNSPRKNPSLPR